MTIAGCPCAATKNGITSKENFAKSPYVSLVKLATAVHHWLDCLWGLFEVMSLAHGID